MFPAVQFSFCTIRLQNIAANATFVASHCLASLLSALLLILLIRTKVTQGFSGHWKRMGLSRREPPKHRLLAPKRAPSKEPHPTMARCSCVAPRRNSPIGVHVSLCGFFSRFLSRKPKGTPSSRLGFDFQAMENTKPSPCCFLLIFFCLFFSFWGGWGQLQHAPPFRGSEALLAEVHAVRAPGADQLAELTGLLWPTLQAPWRFAAALCAFFVLRFGFWLVFPVFFFFFFFFFFCGVFELLFFFFFRFWRFGFLRCLVSCVTWDYTNLGNDPWFKITRSYPGSCA